MPEIIMYSTWRCPYCARARRLFAKKGVPVSELRVDEQPALREEMTTRSQRQTVPQVFIDGTHIGGFDELVELDLDGELDPLLGL